MRDNLVVIKRYLNDKTNWLLVLFFLSLPFERLLTLEIVGYTLKISYMMGIIVILYFLYLKLQNRNCHSCGGRNPVNIASTLNAGPLDPRLRGDDRKESEDDTEKGTGVILCKIQTEEKYLLLFVLISYLTTFWSIDPKRTLIISTAFLLMALVFMVVRRLVNEDNREKFENIIIWLGVGTSVFALWQFLAGSIPSLNSLSFLRPQYQSGIFGFPRVQSTFLEPQYFANFLILPLLLAIKRLITTCHGSECHSCGGRNPVNIASTLNAGPLDPRLRGDDRKESEDDTKKTSHLEESTDDLPCRQAGWIPAFAGMTRGGYLKLGLISLGFFLTLSRGAEYALVIALLVLAFLIYITDRAKLKAYGLAIITIIAGVVVGTLMILAAAGKTGVQNYFGHATTTNLTTNEGTTDRSSTSEVAYGVFLSNPMGIGSGAFGALPIYKDQIPDKGYQIVNNEYLEILAEDGILGMLFFGLFILGLIIYLIREIKNGRKEAAFLLAAVVAILIQYLVFSTFYFAYLWVFLAFVWPAKQANV